jgi:hypothetical protein
MKALNQTGALHLAAILGVLVVGVIAFAGYRVMNSDNPSSINTISSSSAVPDKISTQADLTQTSKALDDTDTQLDASLNDAALDSDINALL